MILGIGNDIIEVGRIKAIIERHSKKFLDRIFTSREQDYCFKHKHPALHFAGRFAAKEAVSKALGSGFRGGLNWTDIEIINDLNGKPIVVPSIKLNSLFDDPTILVSISHCHQYATAFALWTKNVTNQIHNGSSSF
jgi:holo-[acyl-carrier protein] synthase